MNRFVAKIKRKENVFYSFLYKVGKKCLAYNIPVGFLNRWFYLSLLKFKQLGKCFFLFFKQKLYVEPTTKSLMNVGNKVHIEEIPSVSGNGDINFGDEVHVSGNFIVSFVNKYTEKPILNIGHNTFIGHMTRITVGGEVTVGNHVLLGANCMIMDNDGHPHNFKERRNGLPVEKDRILPVNIEDDVWLGNGVLVLKGVTIGARSIIAARSLVTKNIPPDSLAGGNPCKILKSLRSAATTG